MSLEEENIGYILNKYEIEETDKFKILSIVRGLTKENDKLISELNRKVLRSEMPPSLSQTYTKKDEIKKTRKNRKR